MWMVTTDDRGFVKYWQCNFNNVHTFQAHSDPVKCCRLGILVVEALPALAMLLDDAVTLLFKFFGIFIHHNNIVTDICPGIHNKLIHDRLVERLGLDMV